MSRKSPDSRNGFADVIGVALLLLIALPLLVALISFNRYDLSFVRNPPHNPPSNWIGIVGAYLAWFSFLLFGVVAYLLPFLIAMFGIAYLLNFLRYLRERLWWSLFWSGLLLVSLCGLFHIMDNAGLLGKMYESIGSQSAGGWLGFVSYGQTPHYEYGFCLLGRVGATIVYSALCLISLLFLTNFRLGDWIRRFLNKEPAEAEPESADEIALDRRARELERQAKKLKEEVERSGLGADLQPVPEPTVRDLSVPQAKPASPRIRKTTLPESAKEPEAASSAKPEEPPPRDVAAAATTEEVLGRKSAAAEKPVEAKKETVAEKVEMEKSDGEKGEPAVNITDNSGATAAPKPRAPRKPKPITVAATPIIGNYQLPPMDFLQHAGHDRQADRVEGGIDGQRAAHAADAGAVRHRSFARRHHQGPDHHALRIASGARREAGKNLRALQQHRRRAQGRAHQHSRARSRQKLRGRGSAQRHQDQGHHARSVRVRRMAQHQGAKFRSRWARTFMAILSSPTSAKCRTCSSPAAPAPASPSASTPSSRRCSTSFRPTSLRFVMIDPKVVELQQYNALPHLVVPVVTDPKKVMLALRWVVNEMEKRYKIFARVGVRNIKSFNERPKNKPLPQQELELPLTAKKEKVEPGADGFAVEVDEEIVVPREEDIVIPEKLSYIVVIIDELADLMLVAPADVEMAIARITQMARAAGIHCIVATQRPSVDVITGVIKANIPARIAFQVAAAVDSRTILDAMGADKLLGKGDMLYLPPGSAKLIRAQGALITDQEIKSIVDFIAKQGKPSYEMEIHQQLSKARRSI